MAIHLIPALLDRGRRQQTARVGARETRGLYRSARWHHSQLQRILGYPRYLFKSIFRMSQPQYRDLLTWLKAHTLLHDSRKASAGMKLLIFLYICAFNEPQRNAGHVFKLSQPTISHIFNEVLLCMQTLHISFVRQPAADWVAADLLQRSRNQLFDDCLGYIDGVLVHAHVTRLENPQRFWCRKGYYAQNVLAAVRPDGTFSYVLAGAPGSTHDSTLLGLAATQEPSRAFTIPPGRYYLGDSGFGSGRGIVVPYPRVPYHRDPGERRRRSETRKELFNRRHAGRRVLVEQVFGEVKRKWKIVRCTAPEYSFKKQIMLVYALTGHHNFMYMDGDLKTWLEVNNRVTRGHRRTRITAGGAVNAEAGSRVSAQEIRRRLAVRIWRHERGA